jgi:heptosyltransferase II
MFGKAKWSLQNLLSMKDAQSEKKILIRLPNWLGDLVMSTAFVRALSSTLPNAKIEVIVKKGIDTVVDYLPGIQKKWVFSKDDNTGITGAWAFGKKVAAEQKPDIFFCLPDSFSSAIMARATAANMRVGYGKEFRSWLLTHTIPKNSQQHRAVQYLSLLEAAGLDLPPKPAVFLQNNSELLKNRIIVNVNSEAEARRLPVEKAIAVIDLLREKSNAELVLVGSPKEYEHVNKVFQGLRSKEDVCMMAGKTNLKQYIDLLGTAPVMLTTDSGPMHLANALGVHTVALEGASDEKNTAPFNVEKRTLIRSGLLPCEPCVKNVCQFGIPKCLINIEDSLIVQQVLLAHKNATN